MRTSKPKKRGTTRTPKPSRAPAAKSDANEFIPAPKLRARLGISAVTLWRWRRDELSGFPTPKVIKGRLYFPASAVTAWLDKQPSAA